MNGVTTGAMEPRIDDGSAAEPHRDSRLSLSQRLVRLVPAVAERIQAVDVRARPRPARR